MFSQRIVKQIEVREKEEIWNNDELSGRKRFSIFVRQRKLFRLQLILSDPSFSDGFPFFYPFLHFRQVNFLFGQ